MPDTQDNRKIGFIGLGSMGSRMASRLLDAGFVFRYPEIGGALNAELH